MSATMAQKILARAAGKAHVQVNEIVTAKADLAMANDITAPLTVKAFRAAGATRVFDPDRIAIFAGRHMPFPSLQFATDVGATAQFCEEQGIRNFFANGEGMDHAVAPELGLFRPGMLVLNADSHACTAGALGTLSIAMGSTDMAYVFAFGESWLLVPSTIRVRYSGQLPRFVTSKDLGLATLRRVGVDGARYKVLEFCGETLNGLEQDERFTIANLAIEMGAKSAIMEPDAKTRAYLAKRTDVAYDEISSDADAEYEATVDIDAASLRPQVARPWSPSDVVPAAALTGKKITQVSIGTCTNGRMVDLLQAAEVLRGKKVAKGVRLVITPASIQCYQEAVRSGLVELLMEAGATVNPPGCGPCAGIHMGVLNAQDVCVATHNRNFHGRMGHRDAEIYLASPYVAAASAIAGTITDPREVLQ